MAKHFMSVIGTGLYEPVIYADEVYRSTEQEYFQLALIGKFREQLQGEDDKITIFATDGARDRNIKNRIYTDKDVDFSKRWKSSKKKQVVEGNIKVSLKEQLEEQYPELKDKCKIVPIDNAQDEQQIWNVFQTLYDAMREEDEIIFDITHSFRSIPMLAMTVINYAKVLKNCSLKGMYYGAYEGAKELEDVKEAAIIDLTMYDDILSWTSAADVFMRFGNASMIKECYERRKESIPRSEMREWSDLSRTIDRAEALSDALQTARGVDVSQLKRKISRPQEVSIRAAYKVYADSITEKGESKAREIRPLMPLLEKTTGAFKTFDRETNYEVGIAVVQWSIDNGMIQQGYTALEETIKTYLCYKYHLDEVDKAYRDDIIGYALNSLKVACAKKVPLTTVQDRLGYLDAILQNSGDLDNYVSDQSTSEEIAKERNRRKILEQIFTDDNVEIAKLTGEIKDKRNDINHFGMRPNPMTAAQLKEHLSRNYQKFVALIEERTEGA